MVQCHTERRPISSCRAYSLPMRQYRRTPRACVVEGRVNDCQRHDLRLVLCERQNGGLDRRQTR